MLLFTFTASADIVTLSWNPEFHGGERGSVPVTMYEDRSPAGETPDGNPFVMFENYGSAPRTTFTASDYVYLGVGFDLMALTEQDMVMGTDGNKYFPRVWWQVWAPGVDFSSAPTWEYKENDLENNLSWATISDYQSYILGYDEQSRQDIIPYYSTIGVNWLYGLNSNYSDSAGYGDLWSVAGGFQEGDWNYRLLVEVPTVDTDPWVAILGDGSLSDPVYGDNVTWEDIARADIGVSGSVTATAVPERQQCSSWFRYSVLQVSERDF
jgi:hypothetical protein